MRLASSEDGSAARVHGPEEDRRRLPLHERPAEVENRLVIGHWQGDLIVGRRGLSHLGTLVEQHSRYVVLLRLQSCRTDDVVEALTATVGGRPSS